MAFQIHTLRQETEAYLAESPPVGQGPQRYPLLFSQDAYFFWVEQPTTEAAQGWRAFLAERVMEAASQRPLAAHADLLQNGVVRTDEEALPLPRVRREIRQSALRLRRSQLEAGLAELLRSRQGIWEEWAETLLQRAGGLNFPSPLALHAKWRGWDPAELRAQARGLLASTEDAYREVLGYALRKVDPERRPLPGGDAAAHDLDHALSVPWLSRFLPGEELQRSTAEVRRAWRLPEAAPSPTAGSGLSSYRAYLTAQGKLAHQQSLADLCFEGRHFFDRAERFAQQALHRGLLVDEGWLRRSLRLATPLARECARMAAFAELSQLRRVCILLEGDFELAERGSVRETQELCTQRMAERMFLREAPGLSLLELEPGTRHADLLRGSAMAWGLFLGLRQEFNEDYWRNPGAGEHLARSGAAAAIWNPAPLLEALNR